MPIFFRVMHVRLHGAVLGVLLAACGGPGRAGPEIEAPPPPPPPDAVEAADPSWETGRRDSSESEPEEEPSKVSGGRQEPEFTEGMNVDEAMAAVSSDWERLELEQSVLAAPLLDPETYGSCPIKGQKFRVRLAVWDGRVVGAEVTSASKKLAGCVEEQVRKLEYKDKVKSINTIEYAN